MKKSTMEAIAKKLDEAKFEVYEKLAIVIGDEAAEAFMKDNYDTFFKFTAAAVYAR